MSSKQETGRNVATAFQVVLATYANVEKLLRELDGIARTHGFSSITPRPLRYKSDDDIHGWLIKDFIKLYRPLDESIREPTFSGPVYSVEISFEQSDCPKIIVAKYFYPEDGGPRRFRVSPADHHKYYHPVTDEVRFPITDIGLDGPWFCRKSTLLSKNYNQLKYVIYKELELMDIQTADEADKLVFGVLEDLIKVEI